MQNSIVIYSGGLDSGTLLWSLVKEGKKPLALSFDYGQRHKKELGFATSLCNLLGVEHRIVNLDFFMSLMSEGSSVLLGQQGAVPEGHYEDESMKATIVPNRNAIMLSIACGVAVSKKISTVYYAAHANDYAIYPDCRKNFIEVFSRAMQLANGVEVLVPFVDVPKAEIVKLGIRIGMRFDLAWSCYNGRERACGKCGTCVERLEAFQKNNYEDPIQYE